MDNIPKIKTSVCRIDEYAAKGATLREGVVMATHGMTDIVVAWLPADGEEAYINRETGLDLYEDPEAAITAYIRREESRLRRQLKEIQSKSS